MAKNGKIDLGSANHTNCNIRYFVIKFSGYIAYEMQFDILYCFIKPFIYEYLIFTFISGDFLRNSQNMGKNGENTPTWWARQAQVVRDICVKFGHYRHQNKGFKDKGLRFWCIFMKEINWWLLSSYWGHSEKKLQNCTFSRFRRCWNRSKFKNS